ncbi:MAG: molybdopterin-dependent oxidoreductase, partial [bacterium]|nr:molybdopterin-dependent oxidoreductase [bacterium]
TICSHCSNGCRTTLGVRNNEIVRGNNRDRSGINGEFLCVKGRYGFDFVHHPERLLSPLMRSGDGLEEVSWSKALAAVAGRFSEVKERDGKFGVVGSNHTTNEENYYLQKLVRQGLGSNNIDHHRTGDVAGLVGALAGKTDALATTADLYRAKAVLIVSSDLSQQHPLLAWQVRANWRHHGSRTYVVAPGPVREDGFATRSVRASEGEELAAVEGMREALAAEPELVVVFGDSVKGAAVRQLVEFGKSLSIPVKYVCLVDYSNSRGAMDFGLTPELLPGYKPAPEPGLTLPDMVAAEDLDVF